ncbi:MAG: DUF2062 domain-containing protein [Microcoleaceae cyanobacterium]
MKRSRLNLSRNRWWRWLRRVIWRLSQTQGSPEYLARGLALGVFAGCFPFFGLQILMGVTLAIIFRGHRLLAAAGTWVSNPFTYVPIYLFNYQVGRQLIQTQAKINPKSLDLDNLRSTQDILDMGLDVASSLIFGCLVVGMISALLAYFMSWILIHQWRRR